MKPILTLIPSGLLAALAAATTIHAQETAPAPAPPAPVAPAPAQPAPTPTPAQPPTVPAPGFPGGSGGAPTPTVEVPAAPTPEPVTPLEVPAPHVPRIAIPTPARVEPTPTGSGHPLVQPPGGPAVPSQPPLTQPPAEGSGFGGVTIQRSAKAPPLKKAEIRSIARTAPVKKTSTLVANGDTRPRGEDIIRDTKLRVFQRHYETVLNEAIQSRIALLDATPENQESLKARQAALEEIARNLEEEIRHLSGPPQPNVIISPSDDNLPGVGSADPTIEALPPAAGSSDGVSVELRDAEGNALKLTPPVKEKTTDRRDLRNQIGIEVQDFTESQRRQFPGEIDGIVVTAVEPGSPADGQIFRGAVIHQVDNVRIDSVEKFFSILSTLEGKKFALRFIWRGQAWSANIALPNQAS